MAQVRDNPHLAFTKAYEPFRKSFDSWNSIVGQSASYGPSRPCRSAWVRRWLPPQLRDDRYLPGCAGTWQTRAPERTRRRRAPRPLFTGAADPLEEARSSSPSA